MMNAGDRWGISAQLAVGEPISKEPTMHDLIKRFALWFALLGCVAQPIAGDAQGIDPGARGLAGQAKAAATINTTALGGRTMLGEKLRRAASRASVSNPITARPWLSPNAYANSTALRLGQVISNGGNWYVVTVAGTTASSGTGPTGTTPRTLVTDGTVSFSYLGGAIAPDTGTGAPAITLTTTDPALGLKWYPQSLPNSFKARGGTPTAYSTYGWQFTTFTATAGGAVQDNEASVSFVSDDSKIDLFLPANSSMSVLVDGRQLQPGNFTVAVDTHLIIDWSATSARGRHEYEAIVFKATLTTTTPSLFGFVETSATGNVFAPTSADEATMVYVGDSYLAGSAFGPWIGAGRLVQQVGLQLGIKNRWNFGIGGTGYLSPGAGPYYTFDQRIAQVAALKPDIVITMGSVNDKSYGASAITAAVAQYITDLRAALPNTPLVIIGCQPIDLVNSIAPAGSGLSAAQLEAAVQAGVNQVNDSKTWFIPMATTTVPWVTSSWNNTGTGLVGTPANTNFMLATDGVHPPEYGTGYYAQRIIEDFKAKVLPNL